MRKDRGFTMTELLVALLVGSVVVTSLVTITRSMAQETTAQQMLVEASQGARTAMATLKADFMRTGMYVSPDPQRDPDSLVASSAANASMSAYTRKAIVHLNQTNPGPDSVVLVGNFIGTECYEAEVVGGTTIQTSEDTLMTDRLCLEQFDPAYAFAHIINTRGQNLDAKVAAVNTFACDGGAPNMCRCRLTFNSSELPTGLFSEFKVKVAANQAALYRVESVGGDNVLMRYFIDYDGLQSPGAGCTTVMAGDSQIAWGTGTVIAHHVQDFQVWFRPVKRNFTGSDNDIKISNYHAGAGGLQIAGGNTAVPSNQQIIMGPSLPDDSVTQTHLTCGNVSEDLTTPPAVYGPGHVRSAMIRLSIRTERTDQSIRDYPIDPNSGLARYNLSSPPAGDVGMYKLRTLITEVPLFNIASRMASFQDISGVTI